MIHDILEQKLQAHGFIPGSTLFRNYMPATTSIGVMTRVPLQGLPINENIPDYYKGQMQVVVRHKDPDAGAHMADQVQRILTQITAREVYPATADRGEVHLDVFFPETVPISFPRMSGNGYEWSQHFRCAFGVKRPADS